MPLPLSKFAEQIWRGGRGARWLFLVAALVPLINARHGGNHFVDDAYYYLVPAAHFPQTGFFSLDGIIPTNGFHPLWMWLLTATYWLVGAQTPESQVFWLIALQSALLAVAGFAWCHGEQAETRSASGGFQPSPNHGTKPQGHGSATALSGLLTMTALLLFPPIHALWFSGMEAALVITLILFWARTAQQNKPTAGIWAALLFLARLDTLVFIIAPWLLGKVLVGRWKSGNFWRSWLVCAAPATGVSLVVIAYNVLTTGHVSPISGALKSSFPVPTPHWEFFLDPIHAALHHGKWLSLFLVPNLLNMSAVALVMGWVAWRGFRAGGVMLNSPSGVMGDVMLSSPSGVTKHSIALLYLLSLLNLVLFQQWAKGIEFWYWAVPVGLALVWVSWFGDGPALRLRSGTGPAHHDTQTPNCHPEQAAKLSSKDGNWAIRPRLLPPLSKFAAQIWRGGRGVRWLLLLLLAYHLRPLFLPPPPRYPDQAIDAIHSLLPKEAVLAATDVGDIACWSGRKTINLDGLMNTFSYQDVLKDRQLYAYLRAQGVTHLLGAACTVREREPMYHYRFCPEGVKTSDYRYQFFVYSYLYHRFSDTLALTPAQEVWHSEPFTENGNTYRQFIWKLP